MILTWIKASLTDKDAVYLYMISVPKPSPFSTKCKPKNKKKMGEAWERGHVLVITLVITFVLTGKVILTYTTPKLKIPLYYI